MRWLRKNLIGIIAILVLVYLFIPIAVIMALSFNNPKGKFNISWNEFSLDAWTDLCGVPGVCSSFVTSIEIGLIATLAATLLGTMISFALVRYRFRGRSTTNLLIFLPMATPEVVLGASLLALFLNLRFPLGVVTVAVAHIMFIISFVVVTVKARLQGMDPRLEEAARDLYSNPRAVFRHVTFPLVLPGILGAALLGFSLSFDDFIISYFNAGTLVTFPIFIWGAAQRGIPVQVNALATIVFLVALTVVLTGQYISHRRRKALEAPLPAPITMDRMSRS
jgi:spermidine/putrescine transport system permease protein